MNAVTATVDLNAIAQAWAELPLQSSEEADVALMALFARFTEFKVEQEG